MTATAWLSFLERRIPPGFSCIGFGDFAHPVKGQSVEGVASVVNIKPCGETAFMDSGSTNKI